MGIEDGGSDDRRRIVWRTAVCSVAAAVAVSALVTSLPVWVKVVLVAVAIGLTYVVVDSQARLSDARPERDAASTPFDRGTGVDVSGAGLLVAGVLVVVGALFLLTRVDLPGGDDSANGGNGDGGDTETGGPQSTELAGPVEDSVSPSPELVALTSLPIAGGTGYILGEHEPFTLDGTDHDDGISFPACFGSYDPDPAYVDFSLGGGYAELRATVAVDDMTPSPFAAELEFRADDVVVGTARVAIGEPQEIRVPLRGATRLRVLFAPLEGAACGQAKGAVLVSPVLNAVSDLDDPPTSPEVTDLLDLQIVSGEWFSNAGGSVPIAGEIFPRSFVPGFCFGPDVEEVEYAVAGYERLVGYVGVSDLAPGTWRADFEFLVNDAPVQTYQVTSGAPAQPIDVPLSTGVRLRIRVTTHEGAACDSSTPRGPVLGAPRLLSA